jgi:ankyrin repeat protein
LVQARALLRNGSVDINSRDRNGRTALMLAVIYRHEALVRELLERGADPNSADAQGRTPLSVAQEQNQRGMAALLRQAGAH